MRRPPTAGWDGGTYGDEAAETLSGSAGDERTSIVANGLSGVVGTPGAFVNLICSTLSSNSLIPLSVSLSGIT